VTSVEQDWPERSFRERSWVTPTGFFERIDDAGLIDIVRLTVMQHAAEQVATEA
jgi:EAL domain-containing protein (putative c-di-GMP-specific phosphodiesterase class I)